MNEEQLQQIKDTVASSIESTVNGKIRVLTQEFRDYVAEDTAWRRKYEPYLEGLANLSGGAKIVVWIMMGVGTILGGLVAIKNYLK